MMFLHTYSVIVYGELDVVDFFEYQQGGMYVAKSADIPLALIAPKRWQLKALMKGAIIHHFGQYGIGIIPRHEMTSYLGTP